MNIMNKLVRSTLCCVKFLLNAKTLIGKQTYYPEKQRKGKSKIFCEQLAHTLKYGENNRFYFVYGLDIVGRKDDDYMDHYSFMKLRDGLNMPAPYNYVCLLRDKELFGIVASEYGVRTASNLATIRNGMVSKPLDTLLKQYNHLFCKPVDDYCGNGIFEVSCSDGNYYLDSRLSSYEAVTEYIKSLRDNYIVQPYIEQHKDISAIYDKSLNTIRIVTVNPNHSSNPDDIVVLGKLLRLGANGLNVDNWAKGGLVVGINDDGALMKYGYYKPGYGTKTVSHPDSGFIFEGMKIPMYEELIALVKYVHSKLNKIHSVGWDVAITSEGPLFIEGNDNYELGFLQTCFGGMRKDFEKYFNKKH